MHNITFQLSHGVNVINHTEETDMDILGINDIVVDMDEATKGELTTALTTITALYNDTTTRTSHRPIWREMAKMIRKQIKKF